MIFGDGIGNVLQKDLVDILQGEIRKNGISNLVISVSKVIVTTDLSIAKVFLAFIYLFSHNLENKIETLYLKKNS